jgi:hypothetical protein
MWKLYSIIYTSCVGGVKISLLHATQLDDTHNTFVRLQNIEENVFYTCGMMFGMLHGINPHCCRRNGNIYIITHVILTRDKAHWRIWKHSRSCKIIDSELLPGFVWQRPPYGAFGLKYGHVIVSRRPSATSTQCNTNHDPKKKNYYQHCPISLFRLGHSIRVFHWDLKIWSLRLIELI